ncbi:unnamed protein product [Penicillium salamii]|nr:unnamed protein product [Penicillium salamii]
MTTMLMGKMMALIQGRKIAEDDEHTETDTTDSQKSERKLLYRDGDRAARQVERGFAAEAVRDSPHRAYRLLHCPANLHSSYGFLLVFSWGRQLLHHPSRGLSIF